MSAAMYSDGPDICSGLSEAVRLETEIRRVPPRFGAGCAVAASGITIDAATPPMTARREGWIGLKTFSTTYTTT